MFNRRIITYALLTITAIALCLPIGRIVVMAKDADSLQIFLPFIQSSTGLQSVPPLSQSADTQGPLLFGQETDLLSDADEPGVVRERQVAVNIDFLDSSRKAGRRQTIDDKIVLNLFSDSQYVAELIRTEPLDDGGYAWIGEIPEIELSQVTIIVRDGLLAGNIRLPSGLYQLRPSGNELHVISEVDGSAFHETEEDTLPAPYDDTPPLASDGETDDGSIIDVMVVYGPDAMNAVGGQAAMENLIDLGFTETNTAYKNSGVTYRIRKVHTHQTDYTSSGSGSTDINRLRLPNDGYMDEIHVLRDLHGADLVSLWLEGGSCGIGYVHASASSAFSVANRTCATGNLTFGHEIGHNMGARHDWYADSSAGTIAYNHGYVHTSDGSGWRTLMAYNALCNMQGFYCTRLTQVSNPNIMVSGSPSGVAEGTNASCIKGDADNPPCDAHNAQVFNDRAFTVANFRASVIDPAPVDTPTSEPSSTPTNTLTNTPVDTATPIPTNTPVDTATATPTDTPTSTPVDTATPIPTNTPVDTATPVPTVTPIPTNTPVDTATPIPTDTPTSTPTDTPVDTVTPIPTDTPTLIPTLTATSTAVPAAVSVIAPIVEDFALADIAGAGRVRRSYTRTQADDGRVQSVRERLGGTNRGNRYNYLVHTWQFNVTGGDKVTFYANAFSNQSRDGDTFIFAYSTDNENYTDLFAVSHGDREILKSAALPDSISGTVYIRVTDSDQSRGTSRRDSVYVDYLSIHSENALIE